MTLTATTIFFFQLIIAGTSLGVTGKQQKKSDHEQHTPHFKLTNNTDIFAEAHECYAVTGPARESTNHARTIYLTEHIRKICRF